MGETQGVREGKGKEKSVGLTVKEGSRVDTSTFNSIGKIPHLVKRLALCQSGDNANKKKHNV